MPVENSRTPTRFDGSDAACRATPIVIFAPPGSAQSSGTLSVAHDTFPHADHESPPSPSGTPPATVAVPPASPTIAAAAAKNAFIDALSGPPTCGNVLLQHDTAIRVRRIG